MIKNAENPHQMGITDRIRGAAREFNEQGCFSKQDIYYHLDDCEPVSLSFHRSWYDFLRRGEIVRIGREKYRYINKLKPEASVRRRIVRAMYIKGAFCSIDIHRLTGADTSYILSIMRKLAKRGWLELTGKSDKGKVFRVKHNDKFYHEFVRVRQ